MHACFLCKHCAVVVPNDEAEQHFKWKCTGLDMNRASIKKFLFERPTMVVVKKLSFSLDNRNLVC